MLHLREEIENRDTGKNIALTIPPMESAIGMWRLIEGKQQ